MLISPVLPSNMSLPTTSVFPPPALFASTFLGLPRGLPVGTRTTCMIYTVLNDVHICTSMVTRTLPPSFLGLPRGLPVGTYPGCVMYNLSNNVCVCGGLQTLTAFEDTAVGLSSTAICGASIPKPSTTPALQSNKYTSMTTRARQVTHLMIPSVEPGPSPLEYNESISQHNPTNVPHMTGS